MRFMCILVFALTHFLCMHSACLCSCCGKKKWSEIDISQHRPELSFWKGIRQRKESSANCAAFLKPKAKMADWLVLGMSIQIKASGLLFFPTWAFEFINTTRLGFFVALSFSSFSCVGLKMCFCSELIMNIVPFLLICWFARGTKRSKIAIFIEILKAMGESLWCT